MQETEFVWMSGKMLKWKDATTHFLTHSLHYGTAVFEGLRCYNTDKGPAVFRMKEHVKRLFDSAHIMQIKIPYTQQEITEAIIKVVKENNLKECYIRPLVYYGYGIMGLSTKGAKVEVGISTWLVSAAAGSGPAISSNLSRHRSTTIRLNSRAGFPSISSNVQWMSPGSHASNKRSILKSSDTCGRGSSDDLAFSGEDE